MVRSRRERAHTGVKTLSVAAAIEILAGLILAASPSLVARLVFNADLSHVGEAIGRLGGFGLFALGVACWPRGGRFGPSTVRGLLSYNALAAIFFLWLGIRGELVGVLLWPAAVLHAALSVLLARVLLVSRTI
jgi:hypothetical protein